MRTKSGFLNTIISSLILVFWSTTAARGQEIKEDNYQVRPLQSLTGESFLSKAQIGMSIAVELYPSTKMVMEMADLTQLVLDEAVTATVFRNRVVESHLLVASSEAKQLEEIRQHEGNLILPKAQIILGDLKRGHFSQEDTGMFLAKSILSGRMAYGVASHYLLDRWMKRFFGKTLARRLPVGNRLERMWISKKSIVRTHTNIRWRYLSALGESSRKLADALKVVLLEKLGKRLARYVIENELDEVVEDILREHPSIPEATTVLRLNMMNDPGLMAPIAQAALTMPPAAAAVPIAIPREIRVQRDPVVSAASVQHQVIEEQHYHVSFGGSESANSEPVEHPTHSLRLPTSINARRGSFTGGTGSTLFTRF